MFIELAEALDCPVCEDRTGLVAFVDEADRRRVIAGRLGCFMCEVEFPIAGGVVDFRRGENAVPQPVEPSVDPSDHSGSDTAMKLAALLGLGERTGAVVLLGRGLAIHASAIAQMSERVEVIAAIGDASDRDGWSLEDLAAGANPVLGLAGRWPISSGALAGIALLGALGDSHDEVVRCLAPGARLVLLSPVPTDIERLTQGGFGALGADERTWVGARS